MLYLCRRARTAIGLRDPKCDSRRRSRSVVHSGSRRRLAAVVRTGSGQPVWFGRCFRHSRNDAQRPGRWKRHPLIPRARRDAYLPVRCNRISQLIFNCKITTHLSLSPCSLRCRLHSLQPGHAYQLLVYAVNAKGRSNPPVMLTNIRVETPLENGNLQNKIIIITMSLIAYSNNRKLLNWRSICLY